MPARSKSTGLPKLTEKAFMAQIKKLALMTGWTWYHPYDSRKSTAGFPDLVLIRPPRIIFAELKVETGFLTPKQQEWAFALRECPGVKYYLWTPKDWDEIEAALLASNEATRKD
jgi:hypothetical protein